MAAAALNYSEFLLETNTLDPQVDAAEFRTDVRIKVSLATAAAGEDAGDGEIRLG